jgi:energy-coupling factor transporter ATP-binding protein EcfA2
MKIKRITVENFLGLRDFRVQCTAPILLVCGENGVGKSSLREALALAWLAQTPRVKLKGEWGDLVTEGAKQARIEVDTSNGAVQVSITAAGKVADSAAGVDPHFGLAEIVTAQRFASMSPDERREFLLYLNDTPLDGNAIVRRLIARGCAKEKVDEVAPMLRSGWAAGAAYAAKRTTEARGAWKAVTGETYGYVKAEKWRADPGDWKTEEAAQLQALDATIEKLRADHAAAQRRLGAVQRDDRWASEYRKKLAALRTHAAELAAHQAAVHRAEEQLTKVKASLASAREAAGIAPPAKPKTCACPACGVELVQQADGSLVEYAAPAPVPHDPEALATIPRLEAEMSDAARMLAQHVERRNAAERAAQDVPAMEDNMPAQLVQQPDIVAASVASIERDLDTKVELQRKLRSAYERFDAADRRTKEARQHHRDVAEWSAIAEALEPSGIPGEILAEALGPINARLAQSAGDTGWKHVRIGADMSVTASGRAYRLLSDSEQWRCDAQIAEAVAYLSGLRVLVLDRLDVLQPSERSAALGWLDLLAAEGEIDSAIVMGTLLRIPTGLPDTYQAVQIKAGRIVEAEQREPQTA